MTRRLYAQASTWEPGQEIALDQDESHHLLHVLRLLPGAEVLVCDGAGHEALAEVLSKSTKKVGFVRLKKIDVLQPRPVEIVLVQALIKGQKMDLVLQKATELGAAEVVVVAAERSIGGLAAERREHRLHRWEMIIRQGAMQSGNPWLPRLSEAENLAAYLAEHPFDACFVCALIPGQTQPFAAAIAAAKAKQPRRIGVLIGPEGDFTEAEFAAALQSGALPVSLGALTMRAETAALYTMSVLNYEFLWR